MFKRIVLNLAFGLLVGLTVPVLAQVAIASHTENDTVVPPIDDDTEYVETPEDEIACVGRRQWHEHSNEATDTATAEHWGVVHQFAIVLDTDYDPSTMPGPGSPSVNDFLTNINTETMRCTDGDSIYQPCGFDKDADLGEIILESNEWNGTTVTYETLDWIDGSPRGLVWRYGQDNNSDIDLKPWLAAGHNKLEGVSFDPIDYQDYQTATTESWTKMEYFVFNPITGDPADLNDWVHYYTEQVDSNGNGVPDEPIDPDGDFIYWYGLNGVSRSIWNDCIDDEEPVCEELIVTPNTVGVADLLTDTDFTVTALDTNGDDITNEVTFHYSCEGYNGGATVGDFEYGWMGLFGGCDEFTTDSTITYTNAQPGDTLTFEVVGAEGACSTEIEFPYCLDLSIVNTPPATGSGGLYSTDIEVTVEASNGEDWPFDVTYSSTDTDSTFDGNTQPYSTTDWTVFYESDESGTVSIEAEYNVAGLCQEDFDYEIPGNPGGPVCDHLELTPTTVLVNDLFADTDFTVTAIDTLGADITNDVTFHYTCEGFDGIPTIGEFSYGAFGLFGGCDEFTNDNTITYENAQPGDLLTFEVVGAEEACSAVIEYPYCADIYFVNDPLPQTGDLYTTDIEIQVTASNGEDWPFDIEWSSTDLDSTFDGNTQPHITSLPDWTVFYESDESGTVLAEALDDVAGECADDFPYELTPPGEEEECEDLEITSPTPEMEEGICIDIPITVVVTSTEGNTWNSDLTYSSTDSAATFNNDLTPFTTPLTTVTYNSCEGATVTVTAVDDENNVCIDSFSYSPEEIPADDDDDDDDDDECIPGDDDMSDDDNDDDDECEEECVPGDDDMANDDNDDDECEEELGALYKYIFTFNFEFEKNSYSDEGIFFSHDDDFAYYTLEYDPEEDSSDTVTFTDDMWEGDLDGTLGDGSDSGGEIRLATEADITTYSYKSIQFLGLTEANEIGSEDIGQFADDNDLTWIPYLKEENSSLTVTDDVLSVIPECEYDDGDLTSDDVCYDPETSPADGEVVIENATSIPDDAVIRIRYVGIVDSNLQCDDEADECLTEQFSNTGYASTADEEISATADLVVLCSYLVTRGAGDVFLEVEIEQGSDISCIFASEDEAYRNVDSLVILDSSTLSSVDTSAVTYTPTLEESVYSQVTISVCDDTEYEENLVGNLSSYVCEIVTEVSDLWKRSTIEETTDSQISLSVRNADTLQSSRTTFASWDELAGDLKNQNNPTSGVLYFKGDPSNPSDTITLKNIVVPAGAWTLIVEDADLVLSSNISYATSTSVTGNLPSMAFIVENGNIHITTGAHNLVGVYYTDQSFTGNERSAVNDPLTIYGSIYGDIQPLLDAANYVGPPTLDGGGIVVRYDSRILLNTPPSLSEFVNISTEKAVN